jgi:hypothetical protein
MGEDVQLPSAFSWWCLKVLSDILITGLYSCNFYDSEIFSGRIARRQTETRRICYLVHYLVVGRSAGRPVLPLRRLLCSLRPLRLLGISRLLPSGDSS